MGYLCDFCGEQRSIVYCRSDAASLCLSCDSNVHSANALSRRHLRTLACERCNSQPAFVRCIEEKISLCQNCDWMGHADSNICSVHKKEAVNFYSGCPSASELSAVWPFLLDSPSVGDSTCEQGIGLMSITDNSAMDSQRPQGKSHMQGGSLLREASDWNNGNVAKSTVWMESLSPLLEPRLQDMDQHAGSTSSAVPKVFLSRAKGHAVGEDDGFYGNNSMGEVELGIEDYDELFYAALDNPGNIFGDDGIFGTKDRSESNRQGAYAAEGSSMGGANMMKPASSNAVSADSVISCKTEPNLYFTRPAHSGLSFSGVTGESSGGDYQDCGVSSMPITGEPPWYPPCPESSMPPMSRSDAVMRYKEKKKTRKFEKKVRYASRKARADVRRRVKGRFIKAGEPYDYDPLSPSKSY